MMSYKKARTLVVLAASVVSIALVAFALWATWP